MEKVLKAVESGKNAVTLRYLEVGVILQKKKKKEEKKKRYIYAFSSQKEKENSP